MFFGNCLSDWFFAIGMGGVWVSPSFSQHTTESDWLYTILSYLSLLDSSLLTMQGVPSFPAYFSGCHWPDRKFVNYH